MKEILLSQNKVAFVDDEDYERISRWKWSLHSSKKYAVRTIYPQNTAVLLHREVLGLLNGNIEVDHIDANGLNNQKKNLRLCHHQENLMWKQKQSNNRTGYIGVHFAKDRGHYRAEVSRGKQRYRSSNFATAEEAARDRDKAALKLHGKYARLNFIK